MDYQFGALAAADSTTFRLWAPSARSASVIFKQGDPLPFRRVDNGFLEAVATSCPPGTAPLGFQRQPDGDRGALSRSALDADGAAMMLDDLLHGGEADAGPTSDA